MVGSGQYNTDSNTIAHGLNKQQFKPTTLMLEGDTMRLKLEEMVRSVEVTLANLVSKWELGHSENYKEDELFEVALMKEGDVKQWLVVGSNNTDTIRSEMGWINFLMEEAEGYNRELILKKVVRPFKVYTGSNNGTLMGMEINRQHKLDLHCVVTQSVMTPHQQD